MTKAFVGYNERRWNPVFGEWVVMASTTGGRPWQGKTDEAVTEQLPKLDPDCYLCPTVMRASGDTNPDYNGTFAFNNDFASFSATAQMPTESADPLVITAGNKGQCRVLCWSEHHDKTLARLSQVEIEAVVDLWVNEYKALSENPDIRYIMIFENKGKEVGVSNAHPHGQIYATPYMPGRVERMHQQFKLWQHENNRSLLSDILQQEQWRELVVEENEYFVHCVPWAARFPYETWIVPKRAVSSVANLSSQERVSLANIFHHAVIRYDNLFRKDTPNITIHYNAPTQVNSSGWHYFCCFQPPVRDAEKLKYLAGFESGGGDIVNPVSPDMAAEQLRTQSVSHFSEWV